MTDTAHLLDDRQMQRFITNGYLVLRPEFPPGMNMVKFLFTRMEEPRSPSWNATHQPWPVDESTQHPALCRQLWAWHHGDADTLASGSSRQAAHDTMPLLCEALFDADEPVRLNAAYALAGIGEAAVPGLIAAMRKEAEASWESNLNSGNFDNPSQLYSTSALSALGKPAAPALIEALHDPQWWVRAAATAALGDMGRPARDAVPWLITVLRDESEWVRRNAADALGILGDLARDAVPALAETMANGPEATASSLSKTPLRELAAAALAKISPAIPEAVPVLTQAIDDGNEYLRAWASLAMERLNKHEA
jgi:HEAT repeat protein